MTDGLDRLLSSMTDAGCEDGEKEKTRLFYMAGDTEGLLHFLRKCRCDRMEELHRSQRRVDCMDFLIRQTAKTIQ